MTTKKTAVSKVKYVQEIFMRPEDCEDTKDTTSNLQGSYIPEAYDLDEGEEVAVYQFVGIKHLHKERLTAL